MITIIDSTNTFNQDIKTYESVLTGSLDDAKIIFSSDRYINDNYYVNVDKLKFKVELYFDSELIFETYCPVLYESYSSGITEYFSGLSGSTGGTIAISNIDLSKPIRDYLNSRIGLSQYDTTILEKYEAFKRINNTGKVIIKEISYELDDYEVLDDIIPTDISNILIWMDPSYGVLNNPDGYMTGWTAKAGSVNFTFTGTSTDDSSDIISYASGVTEDGFSAVYYHNGENLDGNPYFVGNNNSLWSYVNGVTGTTIFTVGKRKTNTLPGASSTSASLMYKKPNVDEYFNVAVDHISMDAASVNSTDFDFGLYYGWVCSTFVFQNGSYPIAYTNNIKETGTIAYTLTETNAYPSMIFYNYNQQYYEVFAGDIIVYGKILNEQEIKQVQKYLFKKYNIFEKELNTFIIKATDKEKSFNNYNVYDNIYDNDYVNILTSVTYTEGFYNYNRYLDTKYSEVINVSSEDTTNEYINNIYEHNDIYFNFDNYKTAYDGSFFIKFYYDYDDTTEQNLITEQDYVYMIEIEVVPTATTSDALINFKDINFGYYYSQNIAQILYFFELTGNTNYNFKSLYTHYYFDTGQTEWTFYSGTTSYQIVTFGDNTYGQLGMGNTTDYNDAICYPTFDYNTYGGDTFNKQGLYHRFLITSVGSAKQFISFGLNNSGQLGMGNTIDYNGEVCYPTFTGLTGTTANFIVCSADGIGTNHTVLCNGYSIISFGSNSSGQLGMGNTTNYNGAVCYPTFTGVSSVSCGASHTIILFSNGTIASFGLNSSGQLGMGNTTNYNGAICYPSFTGVSSVFSSGNFTFLRDSSLQIIASFGDNSYGQLGMGNTTDYAGAICYPPAFDLDYNYIVYTISLSDSHTTILTYNIDDSVFGHVITFGNNSFGQLCMGNTTDYAGVICHPFYANTSHIDSVKAYGFNTYIKYTNKTSAIYGYGFNNEKPYYPDITNVYTVGQIFTKSNLNLSVNYDRLKEIFFYYNYSYNSLLGLNNDYNLDYHKLKRIEISSKDEKTKYRFDINDDCKYEHQLRWLNRLGGYDTFNFNLLHSEEVNVDESGFYTNKNYLTNTININTFKESYKPYRKNYRKKYTFRTDWLTSDQVYLLEDLFISSEVYYLLDEKFNSNNKLRLARTPKWISMRNITQTQEMVHPDLKGVKRYEIELEEAQLKEII